MKTHLPPAICMAAFLLAASFICPAQPSKRSSVAILELEPKGVPEVEVSALSDRLRGELISGGAFDVMERGKMQEVLKEQGFQQSGACNTDACAVEVGQLIGVEKMIAGSLGRVGRTYSINLRLINVKTGRIERSIMRDYTGEIDKLLTTEMKAVAQQLSYSVGVKPPPPAAAGKPVYKKWWFWGGIGGGLVGGLVAALAGGSGETTPEQPPAEQPVEPPPSRP